MSWTWPQRITQLEGGGIKLEPLTLAHADGLAEAAATASEHERTMGFVPTPDEMKVYVSRAVYDRRAGRSYPFAVCLSTGEPIGTSWFRTFDPWRKKLEIGFTWYATPHRKGTANLQTKLLLMSFRVRRTAVHPGRVSRARKQRAVTACSRRPGSTRRWNAAPSDPHGRRNVRRCDRVQRLERRWPSVKDTIARRLEARRQAGPT